MLEFEMLQIVMILQLKEKYVKEALYIAEIHHAKTILMMLHVMETVIGQAHIVHKELANHFLKRNNAQEFMMMEHVFGSIIVALD